MALDREPRAEIEERPSRARLPGRIVSPRPEPRRARTHASTRRARSPPPRRRSTTRPRPAAGSWPCNSLLQRSSGSPSRSAPRRNVTGGASRRPAQRLAAVRDERDPRRGRSSQGTSGDAEDRAGRGAQRLRRERVGAPVRERHARAERVRRAQQRADVARIGEPPEREAHVPRRRRAGRRAGRRRSRAPGCGSVETRASSSASTVSPATSRCDRLDARAARRRRRDPRPRPRTALSRHGACAAPSSLRTSLRVSLSREVISASRQSSQLPWKSSVRDEPQRAGPDAQLELEARASPSRASVSRRLVETQASGRPSAPAASSASREPRAALRGKVAGRGRLEDDRQRVRRAARPAAPGSSST